jgi:MFS transporter, DHA2 family, methylenomycin A resistance protein
MRRDGITSLAAAAFEAPAQTAGRSLVLLAMCLGIMIAQVDTSVINLAVQPIGTTFQASVASLQWVIDSYNFVYAVLLMSGGLIADLYGRRLGFMLGAAVMTVASLACAFAPGIGILIAGRAIAGVGAALLLPSSLAIIRVVWPGPAERGRVLGIWASCNGLAFVVGPSLGGLLIERFGWSSVFFLVVPLGAAAFALAGLTVTESADPHDRHFDFRGQLLGAITLGGIAYAAIAGREGGSAWAYALGLSVIALPLFLLAEHRTGRGALVPLDMFRNAAFAGATVATGTMTFGIYGLIFLLPMSWQSSGLMGAGQAGLALMPAALVFFFVSPRSGHLSQRLGARSTAASGLALSGCGLLVLAASRAGNPLLLAEVGLLLAGLGMGLCTGPLLSVAVGSVPSARSGTASALINVARMTGATLGVALLGTLFALWHDSAIGFRAAMLTGGMLQLCGAATVWATMRARRALQ